jgi:hypothetical protein
MSRTRKFWRKGSKGLDIFKKRGVTQESILLLLSACILPVFLWAFISLFNQIPALLLKLYTSELIGAIGYVLTFASIESLLVFIFVATILLSITLVLPGKYFGEHLAAMGSFLVFLVAAIFMYLQLNYDRAVDILKNQALLYLTMIGAVFFIYCILILKFPRLEAGIMAVLKRLTSLSILYAGFGLLGIVIVIIRNI